MNILGKGVDIVENIRIKKAITKKSFINRIFTKNEISDSKKKKFKANFFAKRFAAKESFVKALGIGFRDNIDFKDISVINDANGKPFIKLNPKVKDKIKKIFKVKKYNINLSISDEKNYSIAFTIISGT